MANLFSFLVFLENTKKLLEFKKKEKEKKEWNLLEGGEIDENTCEINGESRFKMKIFGRSSVTLLLQATFQQNFSFEFN